MFVLFILAQINMGELLIPISIIVRHREKIKRFALEFQDSRYGNTVNMVTLSKRLHLRGKNWTDF